MCFSGCRRQAQLAHYFMLFRKCPMLPGKQQQPGCTVPHFQAVVLNVTQLPAQHCDPQQGDAHTHLQPSLSPSNNPFLAEITQPQWAAC